MYRDCDSFTNILSISKSRCLPPLVSNKPDVLKLINRFCKENISSLVRTISEEQKDPEYTRDRLYGEFNFKMLAISTVYK